MTPIKSKARLADVQKSFRNWRIDRPERGQRHQVPENLWQQALSLYPEFSPSQICKALRLEPDAFNERIDQKSETKIKKNRRKPRKRSTNQGAPSFTVAKVEDLMTGTNQKWSVSIKRPDGCVLDLKGCGEASLNTLVSQFLGGH